VGQVSETVSQLTTTQMATHLGVWVPLRAGRLHDLFGRPHKGRPHGRLSWNVKNIYRLLCFILLLPRLLNFIKRGHHFSSRDGHDIGGDQKIITGRFLGHAHKHGKLQLVVTLPHGQFADGAVDG